MTVIIVLLSVILFVLIYMFLMLKNALEYMAQKLADIGIDDERIIRILEKLSKNK